ncbi:hypothetical protein KCV07_g123, partial [Aureobasidium melanogenum]
MHVSEVAGAHSPAFILERIFRYRRLLTTTPFIRSLGRMILRSSGSFRTKLMAMGLILDACRGGNDLKIWTSARALYCDEAIESSKCFGLATSSIQERGGHDVHALNIANMRSAIAGFRAFCASDRCAMSRGGRCDLVRLAVDAPRYGQGSFQAIALRTRVRLFSVTRRRNRGSVVKVRKVSR